MPAEIAFGVWNSLENTQVKIKKITLVPLSEPFHIDLRGYNNKHACQKRYKQPSKPESNKTGTAAVMQHKKAHGPGNEKQQRHPKLVEPEIEFKKNIACFPVLYMPSPVRNIGHSGVEKKHAKYGHDTEPVKVGLAVGCLHKNYFLKNRSAFLSLEIFLTSGPLPVTKGPGTFPDAGGGNVSICQNKTEAYQIRKAVC
jgi:hypothetical protein